MFVQRTLIYRAHDAETHPLREELEDLMKEDPAIKVHLFYSVAADGNERSLKYSANALDKIILDKQALFFLCGPASFLTVTVNHLKSIGVEGERIRFENFGPQDQEREMDAEQEENRAECVPRYG